MDQSTVRQLCASHVLGLTLWGHTPPTEGLSLYALESGLDNSKTVAPSPHPASTPNNTTEKPKAAPKTTQTAPPSQDLLSKLSSTLSQLDDTPKKEKPALTNTEKPKAPQNTTDEKEADISFAAAWGTVLSRNLAFWAEGANPSAPALSQHESALLWRLLNAIGVERSHISRSHFLQWPLPQLAAQPTPQALGNAKRMLREFLCRQIKNQTGPVTLLIMGDNLSSVIDTLPNSTHSPTNKGYNLLSFSDDQSTQIHLWTLPTLAKMLKDREQKGIAWEALQKACLNQQPA